MITASFYTRESILSLAYTATTPTTCAWTSSACPDACSQRARNYGSDSIRLSTHILREADKQQLKIKLPVFAQVHEAMQYQGDDAEAMMRAEEACARYLRCFYVLGGSNHSADFIDNTIHVMLILANRNSPIGHKDAQDDAADLDSFVNQHIDAQQYSLIRLPLAFREHDPHACLFYEREADLPFYKYMKFSSRGR